MGKFQIIFLLSVVTCAIISTVQSVPVSDDASVQSENAAKCHKLCGFCGCTGFYCGDECLCECNSIKDGEAECVDTMKSNCKKLELPFEVLIQGPNVNRMVRSLLYANPDEETCPQSSESNQKERSTISIYKPDELQQKDEILTAPKAVQQETHADDSPINYFAAQKLDTVPEAVKAEPIELVQDFEVESIVEDVQNTATAAESNQPTDKANDSLDRVNAKRHIIDVNQDISEFPTHYDDSFIYKRDAEEIKDEIADESVAAAAPPPPAPAPPATPAPPAPPAPLMPKLRKALDNIPSSDEIKNAWEAVRNDMNRKINTAIAAAQQRAADLRSKMAPLPSPANPAPAAPAVVVPVAPVVPPKFNPFLRSEKEGDDVGMALPSFTPLATLQTETEIAKNIAQARAAVAETEFAKSMAAARAAAVPNQIARNLRTKALIKGWNNNNNWLTPWLLGFPLEDSLGSPQDGGDDASPLAEEPPKEQ